MQNNGQENRIIVENVYKSFNIYMDKANSLKEKLSKKKGSSVISDERLKTFITNTWINDSTIKDLMMMNLLQNKVMRYV